MSLLDAGDELDQSHRVADSGPLEADAPAMAKGCTCRKGHLCAICSAPIVAPGGPFAFRDSARASDEVVFTVERYEALEKVATLAAEAVAELRVCRVASTKCGCPMCQLAGALAALTPAAPAAAAPAGYDLRNLVHRIEGRLLRHEVAAIVETVEAAYARGEKRGLQIGRSAGQEDVLREVERIVRGRETR